MQGFFGCEQFAAPRTNPDGHSCDNPTEYNQAMNLSGKPGPRHLGTCVVTVTASPTAFHRCMRRMGLREMLRVLRCRARCGMPA